jgi:hypothetical protein
VEEFRHGALYVVRERPNMESITRELRSIDQRLFLEKQITYQGDAVWCVVCDIGSGQPPVTLLEYRDRDREPIPLDSGIIDRVRRMERDGEKLTRRAIEANKRMVEMQQRRSRDAYEEIAGDMIPRIFDRTRPILHRSQALRMSRDKRRARGERA